MKAIKFTQVLVLVGLLISITSCRTSRIDPYPQNHPPYADNRTYPEYPNYTDNRFSEYSTKDYPVYRDPNPYNLPPGQAKKIYGGKSARFYAPGQRKKYGYVYRRFPLVIVRTPDIVIGRYNDGRFYYRTPEDLWYWKGNDGRFYLDEKYINETDFNDDEYRDWKYRGRKQENNKDEDDWRNRKHENGKHKDGWKHED